VNETNSSLVSELMNDEREKQSVTWTIST